MSRRATRARSSSDALWPLLAFATTATCLEVTASLMLKLCRLAEQLDCCDVPLTFNTKSSDSPLNHVGLHDRSAGGSKEFNLMHFHLKMTCGIVMLYDVQINSSSCIFRGFERSAHHSALYLMEVLVVRRSPKIMVVTTLATRTS